MGPGVCSAVAMDAKVTDFEAIRGRATLNSPEMLR